MTKSVQSAEVLNNIQKKKLDKSLELYRKEYQQTLKNFAEQQTAVLLLAQRRELCRRGSYLNKETVESLSEKKDVSSRNCHSEPASRKSSKSEEPDALRLPKIDAKRGSLTKTKTETDNLEKSKMLASKRISKSVDSDLDKLKEEEKQKHISFNFSSKDIRVLNRQRYSLTPNLEQMMRKENKGREKLSVFGKPKFLSPISGDRDSSSIGPWTGSEPNLAYRRSWSEIYVVEEVNEEQ